MSTTTITTAPRPALALFGFAVVAAIGIVAWVTLAGGSDLQDAPQTAVESVLDGFESPASKTVPGTAADVPPEPVPVVVKETVVEPDLDWEANVRRALIDYMRWNTDFSLHSVAYDEILSGGPPPDGIPPIDDPKFTTTEDASQWLTDPEPVISFELNGDARAYPLQIMTWHEIVNDLVGGAPVAITFCPLCNTAIAFDRILGDVVYDFGTSGMLRNSDLIMWDRQTESWWQQFTGEAIVGELTGTRLAVLPSSIISWSDFKIAHPDGKVLSRDTGFTRSYGRNPYSGYDRADSPAFLFNGTPDGRLLPKERVVDVTIGDVAVVFPFTTLQDEEVINHTVGTQDLAVFHKSGTLSALDKGTISESRDIGATGVFDAHLDGRKLIFRSDGEKIVDNETGSVWSILGKAVEGELSGQQLRPIPHTNVFWFAIAAFRPDVVIYQGMD